LDGAVAFFLSKFGLLSQILGTRFQSREDVRIQGIFMFFFRLFLKLCDFLVDAGVDDIL